MAIERTLSIIKPDGVEKGIIGEVIKRFEDADLEPVAMKMAHLSEEEAEGFYAEHKGKGFFDELIEFMTRGPVVLMVLEGENAIDRNRQIMGATNPDEADEGTIRAEFASSIGENTVHGSDAPTTAEREIRYFFPEYQVFSERQV